MKKCPVCNANCFDDMEVCFGCMHHFAEDEASRTPIIAPRFVPVIADVPEVIEEPPARMEPTSVEFVQTELIPPVPAQADAARGKHAHETTPSAPQLAKVCGATRSGRAALHRRATSPSYARLASGYSPAHAVVVSGEAAQYKLVVSLQPMGNLELEY